MQKVIDWVFHRIDIYCIPGEPYLTRWTLIKLWSGRAIYIHRFTGDDWSRDLHDHPKHFITIGLKGSYIEEYGSDEPFHRRRFRRFDAPWIRSFPPEYTHRIELLSKTAWTLVFAGKIRRMWGFWGKDGWVPYTRYLREMCD